MNNHNHAQTPPDFRSLNVPSNVDFNILEQEILKFWQEQNIFQKSVDARPQDNEYIFYDGPPFANGLPHYGHILTSYIKDTVPRYFTMRGKRVERRFGWDCHGLPAETGAEKELGLNGKQQIEQHGVDKFNDCCRNAVMKYTQIWRDLITRLGRWVDFDNDYKTMDLSYMETILWVFKSLYQKGLIYEGNKVLHYCCRCQTPLSNFEAGLDDAYRMKKDLSLTVKMAALDFAPNTYFLVWTTTPWTLPSNVLLAVGKDFDYVLIKHQNQQYILAEAALERYLKELPTEEIKIIEKFKGHELIGKKYQPLFPYFADTEQAFQVVPGDFVTTSDGTGIVHIAPTFGEDDALLGKKYHIKAPDPVDSAGCFDKTVSDFVGKNVHEVNEDIAKFLAINGLVLKKQKFEHAYPFCWRCDTPLIYRAIPSWYVAVTKVKDTMLECNQQINWIPEHIKNGIFGKWLADARDWAISRNRYWGAPVPIWRCSECDALEVAGSLSEIEELSGIRPTDLHRPAIDEITWPCKTCNKGTMTRVPEVLDCWFESGSMPYAQLHYPFENAKRFRDNFPADFIVEYIGQTRGWFYTLVILAAALFQKPPFKNSLTHGIIFAEDGRKMSKRLKNYPDPQLLIDKYGSDALRFYLLNSAVIVGKNVNFAESGVAEMVRITMLPLWNAYRFFVTYATVDKFVPNADLKVSPNYLDHYILSKLQLVISEVATHMERYDLNRAAKELTSFLEVLNNTYIRRSRRRFWKSENDQDKLIAYQTLYSVLVMFCKIAAPLLPFLTEHIFKNLTGAESVHLEDWPMANLDCVDYDLISEIDRIEQILAVGRTIRKTAGVKVREPRAKVTLAGEKVGTLTKYQDWILEELHVKTLEITEDLTGLAQKTVKLDFKKLGPKVGNKMQQIVKLSKDNQFTELKDGRLQVGAIILDKGDFSFELKMPPGVMQTEDGKIMVALDMTETPEFKKEGIARDLVRQIQLMRKDANLEVSDRIHLAIQTSGIIQEAIEDFKDYILAETLTIDLNNPVIKEFTLSQDVAIDDIKATIKIAK